MDNYPAPARALVADMTARAEQDPGRAVAFQGAPGAFSHMATMELYPDCQPLPCFAFEDAFDAVAAGRARVAVIPIENSLHGRVADIHFLLPEAGLAIVGEHFLAVHQCLLARPGQARADIREALSHPQALGQCRARLREWGIKPVQYIDTAAAAAFVADQQVPGMAAIASRLAAGIYGLEMIAPDIEDRPDNTTRFVVFAREPLARPEGATGLMTSFVFEVRSVPAALFKALGGFATNGVNMTKLESYLSGSRFQAAQFYCEIEGSPDQPGVALALDELRFHSKWLRMLGSYPRAPFRDAEG